MERKSAQNGGRGFRAYFTADRGNSKRTAERVAMLKKRFNRDEREIFRQKKLTQQKIEEISRISNEKQRNRLVALIASDTEFAKAWKKVMKEDIDLTATTKAEKAEMSKAKQEMVPELTDDEWLDQQCGAKSALLGDPTKFQQAALLFRRTSEARAKFRASIKEALGDAKANGESENILWASLNRAIFHEPSSRLVHLLSVQRLREGCQG